MRGGHNRSNECIITATGAIVTPYSSYWDLFNDIPGVKYHNGISVMFMMCYVWVVSKSWCSWVVMYIHYCQLHSLLSDWNSTDA